MIMALHDPERVVLHVLACHKPGSVLAAALLGALGLDATNAETLTLTQRIEAQPNVLPQNSAARVFDWSRLFGDVSVQEIPEWPFTDETYSR